MAYEVVWSPSALGDLVDIAEYIELDSPFNASKVVSKFYDLVGKYGNRPRAATIVPELKNELYRHKFVYGWRVIYRIDDQQQMVFIIAILHGKRQFINIQGRFLE